VDTTELYKIKRIVQVKKNRINITNTIKILSNNSSNNEDNNDPLLNISNKAKNNFKDYIYNKEENNPNTTFFGHIYIHISNISNINTLLI
jgi:hypothetical protein